MNILFISNLSGATWAGPTYSVPQQIVTHERFDNVFWYNIASGKSTWHDIYSYHNLDEFPLGKICSLPVPFNRPDLVVIEQFYCYAMLSIRRELQRSNLPYIIVPRGELTKEAQLRKKWKKRLGNLLVFNKFARKASAIQFLTMQEKNSSGTRWNTNSIVIPNGTDDKSILKTTFNSDKLICTSIGRIEPYQKGLDMLIVACVDIRKLLQEANCQIHLYGPDRENKKVALTKQIEKNGLSNIIHIYDGVYGEYKEQVLLSSDVFIMPSRFEGHPMALIEAMSYGLPCLVTTGSNMRPEVEHYDAGWTADTTADSIRAALISLLTERDKLSIKGRNALALSKKYNWDAIARRSHEAYKELLKNIK